MDEHHWMTSHGCLLVVRCNLLGWMRDGLPTYLYILFGFVNSHLGFAGVLQSFLVCANSHHLTNLANV